VTTVLLMNLLPNKRIAENQAIQPLPLINAEERTVMKIEFYNREELIKMGVRNPDNEEFIPKIWPNLYDVQIKGREDLCFPYMFMGDCDRLGMIERATIYLHNCLCECENEEIDDDLWIFTHITEPVQEWLCW